MIPSILCIAMIIIIMNYDCALANPQFHLSLVGDASGDYILDWTTPQQHDTAAAPNPKATMTYFPMEDKKKKKKHMVAGNWEGLVEEDRGEMVDCWTARLTQLQPGTTYSYHIADDAIHLYNFTVADPYNMTWAVFGDFGSVSQGGASGVSFPALRTADANQQFQGIFHVGDISYELTGKNGMDFMNELESITNHMPLHTAVGNHEYRMGEERAHIASGTASSEFYSFDSGHVHFIVLNSEVYGDDVFYMEQPNGEWIGDEDARVAYALHQAAWMERDLQHVDRTKTPFVVVCSHRPPFTTPHGMERVDNRFKNDILPLLSNYNVDLFLCGHIHAYTRFEATTVYGYRMPPIILSGGAGSNAFLQAAKDIEFGTFQPELYITQYGYGYLTASKHALEWQWGRTATCTDAMKSPTPTDWLIQDSCTIPRQNMIINSKPKKFKRSRMNLDNKESVGLFWYFAFLVVFLVTGIVLIARRRNCRVTRHEYKFTCLHINTLN
eukprot:scaffold380025_cov47-Attheya_sp.AAC.1